MYVLCIGLICILLFINDVITKLFIDVIVRALYIFKMQFDIECVLSGVYCIILKCLNHLTCNTFVFLMLTFT